MGKILIGSDGNSNYIVTAGTRNITLTGISFTPSVEELLYVYNQTQDKLYYAPAKGLSKATVAGSVITYDDSFPVLVAGDVIHIQMWEPNRGVDADGYPMVRVLNPEYAHYTSVEHLVQLAAQGAATSRYVIPFESYKNLSLHAQLVNTNAGDTITVQIWATNNPDADDTANTDWVDVSTEVLGAANIQVNNAVLNDIFFVDTNLTPLKFMVEVVTVSGGTDTNAIDIYIKKS